LPADKDLFLVFTGKIGEFREIPRPMLPKKSVLRFLLAPLQKSAKKFLKLYSSLSPKCPLLNKGVCSAFGA